MNTIIRSSRQIVVSKGNAHFLYQISERITDTPQANKRQIVPLTATFMRIGIAFISFVVVSWLIGYILNEVINQHKSRQQISVSDCGQSISFLAN
jgi:F0F1-type ATP synthase assembly protein I